MFILKVLGATATFMFGLSLKAMDVERAYAERLIQGKYRLSAKLARESSKLYKEAEDLEEKYEGL